MGKGDESRQDELRDGCMEGLFFILKNIKIIFFILKNLFLILIIQNNLKISWRIWIFYLPKIF